MIHPATVGVLASFGLERVKVFARPKVSVIATGSELIPAGRRLKPGKIYDSNSLVVSSILKSMRIEPVLIRTISDRKDILKRALRRAFKRSDVLILTGGVSVGDYDYVKEVLAELGVHAIFWKVSQKPGKPIYFGKKSSKLVFGLPGNPASVFTCFYEYVFPALRCLCGFEEVYLPSKTACLQTDVRADRSRHLFLKGRLSFSPNGGEVTPLRHQASHMISSLCNANCFISLPPRSGVLRRGTKVEAHLLPHSGEHVS
ncbi:MAG: molybdopterin molybdotransferase MoeA [Candidatus Omnitrophica bacterium]|nr:molybdopterin molybdotransferase MoeA [Candidatus Omnitrophota bacterium]